jgi:hypothetical protein
LALVLSLFAIAVPAMVWDAHGLNRYLSLRVWVTTLPRRSRSIPSAPAT